MSLFVRCIAIGWLTALLWVGSRMEYADTGFDSGRGAGVIRVRFER